jgi:ATP phosphoribosyltransferase
LADWLIGKGATRVTSAKYDYVFTADNSLWRRLATRLPGAA